ncbi:hypothetical protein BGZ76_007602 [Entomortierella beljakovae]|nr:hypothetical protein BGZ76_007602 [Entomortierella beljakovae]
MRSSDEPPKNTMTTAENGSITPIELQGPQQKLHEVQGGSLQMNLDPDDRTPQTTEPQHKPLIQQHDTPRYQPRVTDLEDEAFKNNGTEHTDLRHVNKESVMEERIEFYDDDTSSEADLQQVNVADWAESSDAVVQSSDDYGNDMDDIRDEEDDEEEDDMEDDEEEEEDIEDDEENFSDDTGDTDEQQETRGKSGYHDNRHIHHGPYLKSRRQVEHLRKSHGRPGALRKRPLKLRTISSSGPRLDTSASSGSAFAADQSTTPEDNSSQLEFAQTCEEVSRMLHQGSMQQGVEFVKGLTESVIEWRKNDIIPPNCNYTVDQLNILESTYFGEWARILLERRPTPNNNSIVMFLRDFIQLGVLIIDHDNILPDIYAQVLNAMFEQGDLEIYKRNPKRPSRLAHVERMARFDDYAPEYGPEDDEVPQLQQEFQSFFFGLGGLDTCMKAIEFHMNSTESPDSKLRSLLSLLALISRIPVTGVSKLSDLSKRLITAVLGYFPDNTDSFRSAGKAAVLDIISLVGYFLLENYRMQSVHSTSGEELDADYEEFSLQDPVSRSNLGEVKYADFRLEMSVRLMKTSRLDLRLTGLVELKEVLVRIQRLQQGRSRLRRRSDTDMDLQMDIDRRPIE